MKTEHLKNRVDRIEKQRGSNHRTLFALISSAGVHIHDGPAVDEAVKRDIPADVLARASSVFTVNTGVPRAGDGPDPKVENWWFCSLTHEEALAQLD